MLGAFGKLIWGRKKSLGQTVAEYALIVALVAIASIGILKLFGTQLRSLYAAMTKQIAGHSGAEQDDRSGAADGLIDRDLRHLGH